MLQVGFAHKIQVLLGTDSLDMQNEIGKEKTTPMPPIGFNPQRDLAPLPFDDRTCRRALQMKADGLKWQPHVGCFVWDPDNFIKSESPFPNRIYFILSIPRFTEIFGNFENMVEKLVWIPTWHQARLLCVELGVPGDAVSNLWQSNIKLSAGEDLFHIYGVILDTLGKRSSAALYGHEMALDALVDAALTKRLGDISRLPEKLTAEVLSVYHQFIEAYLNILRQKENKPGDWFPQTLSIDPELADDMRHFFSDYQHITRKFFILNRKIDQLQAIDKDIQSNLYQDRVDEILQLCGA